MRNPASNFPPKIPIDGNWQKLNDSMDVFEQLQGYRYESPLGIRVVSSVHIVEKTDGSGVAPHYHISLSDKGQRIPGSIVPVILKQFDAADFEEDNHAPMKIIRSFWKPVLGNAEECPCKDEVKPEIHGDYVWREK